MGKYFTFVDRTLPIEFFACLLYTSDAADE